MEYENLESFPMSMSFFGTFNRCYSTNYELYHFAYIAYEGRYGDMLNVAGTSPHWWEDMKLCDVVHSECVFCD